MDKTIFEISRRRAMAGFRFVCDALPFGRLWYGEPNAVSNASNNAKFYSRSHDAVSSHDAVIRVCDAARNVIQTHQHKGDFKES
ncbi:MAG: hypothetical protein DME59_18875 [Verrucomicrobia bacterium]|nr:MAG: hypothetical protein DME59_18875 [Verrucomicrobiota bacterium]